MEGPELHAEGWWNRVASGTAGRARRVRWGRGGDKLRPRLMKEPVKNVGVGTGTEFLLEGSKGGKARGFNGDPLSLLDGTVAGGGGTTAGVLAGSGVNVSIMTLG